MGEIRKDNLHESLINELEELGNIDLSGKQDKTDESLLTESKDVIGAINELFQNANNGKELIANAIGEPLSSEDTFGAMSNDINGLLSTFKTNMMNNGITVNSGDKFKALIDKIATMVEEGSNKGIQYAEGTIAFNNSGINGNTVISFDNIEFTPTLLIFSFNYFGFEGNNHISCGNIMCNNLDVTKIFYGNTPQSYVKLQLKNITNTQATLTYAKGYDMTIEINGIKYYAIGVGEEDNTLRDSLASILQEEGVSVTEEDDMASLIGKVDEEFENKENEIDTLQQELEENKVIFEDYFEQMIVCRTLNGYREIDPTSLLIHPEVLISDVSYSSITRCWDGTKNRTFAVKNKILYELDDNMNVIKSSNAKAFYYVAAAYGNGQFKLYAGFIENEDSQVGIVDPESLIVGKSAIGRNGSDTITGMGATFNKSTSTFEVYYVGDASNSYLFKISEDASTATTINDIAQKTCRGVGVYYDESTQAIRLFTVDNQQGQVLEMSLSWTSGTIINKRMDPYDNEATNDRPKAVTTWYVKKSRMKYKGQYYYLN